jgi:hypothetical protein
LRNRYRLRRPALRILSASGCISGVRFSTRPAWDWCCRAASARAEIGVDLAVLHGGDVGLADTVRITRDFPRIAAQTALGLVNQRHQRGEVGRAGVEAAGSDEHFRPLDWRPGAAIRVKFKAAKTPVRPLSSQL